MLIKMICWVFQFLINFVGVGQTPEDKVDFLPFSIIREKLMVRKESQRRGGQENGQERVGRQDGIVGRARGGPSLCFRVC